MNKAIIIGNLGADPELRHTSNGTPVCNMRIATNERRKDGDDWVEHTEWHRVTVWGKQGDNCARYLAKGRRCAIDGRIQTRSWETDSGEKRYSTEIVAHRVEFLGGETQTRDPSSGGGSDPAESREGSGGSFSDDEFPF